MATGERFGGFSRETIEFLRELERNNNKRWFDANRDRYEAFYLAPAAEFVESIGPRLRRFAPQTHAEPRVNGSIFRINRDTRFSADKSPYKARIDLFFWLGEAGRKGSPGFFLRLEPTSLLIAAGLHGFEKQALVRYREAVADPKRGAGLARVLARIERAGYVVEGSHYKRVPAGYAADHPREALLRHRGLAAVIRMKPPKEIRSPAFLGFCAKHYRKLAAIPTWLAEALQGEGRC